MPRFPAARPWRTLAALPALLAGAVAMGAPASLDLPAQPLGRSISELARLSGTSIAVDAALVEGKQAPAVRGSFEPAEALRRLLVGTGLVASFKGNQAVVTAPDVAATLHEMTVTATPINADGSTPESGGLVVPEQTFGPLGRLPAAEIPFSTTSIPRTVIDDQQARGLFDIVRNDASITSLYAATGTNAEAVNIRGWTLDFTMGYRMDGGAISFENPISPELFDRVDVYKGLDGFLYGFVAPGGVINYVTKRPLDEPLTRYTQSFTQRSTFGEALDLSRRFGGARQFGVRLNVATENGHQPIDHQHLDRNVVGLALDWKPVAGATLWANASRARSHLNGPQTGFYLDGFPTDGPKVFLQNPHVTTNYGQPWFFKQRASETASLGAEWEGADWHVRASASKSQSRYSAENIFGAALNASGGYTGTALLTTPHSPDDFHGYDALVWRTVPLASTEHKLSVAATGTVQNDNYFWGNTSQGDLSGTLDDPIYVPDPQIPATTTRRPFNYRNQFHNVLAVDSVRINDSLRLIVGVARPRFEQHVLFFGESRQSGKKTAPQAALIVTPLKGVSVYGSYVESYQAGGLVGDPGADNYGSLLPPYVSKQAEAGVKATLDPGLQLNAAYFRMKVPSQFNQPTTEGHYVVTQSGSQVNRGVELSLTGKLSDRLGVVGSLMYLEPRQYLGSATPGSVVAGTPQSVARLFAEYEVPGVRGLTATGGVSYTGRALAVPNDVYFRPYTLADLGAKYVSQVASVPVTLRIYVKNVLNRDHWADGSGGVGEPRTVRASAQLDF